MPPIINAQGLSKRYGSAPLFQNLSFSVSEGDRIGVIGPNGSGKSTLLEILHGRVKPDSGEIAIRKRTRLACVTQSSEFAPGATVRSVIEGALERAAVPRAEWLSRMAEPLGRAGADRPLKRAPISRGNQVSIRIAPAIQFVVAKWRMLGPRRCF